MSRRISSNKVVDGKEVGVGTIIFTYDDQQKTFVSVGSVRNAKWEFKIAGNAIKGTLVYKGNLYRLVDVKKRILDILINDDCICWRKGFFV